MTTASFKNILYKIVRTYNLLLAIIPSIAFYRATVQPDYKWGMLIVQGKGMSEEYGYLVLFMIISWTAFILEAWFKRRWYYVLPIVLFSMIASVLAYGYFSQHDMVFQGDVWKFRFEMGLLFVIVSLVLLLLSIVWAYLDLMTFRKSGYIMSANSRIKLLTGLSISVPILLLFAQGRGGVHTAVDGFAVALTVIQALFLAGIIDRTGGKSSLQ